MRRTCNRPVDSMMLAMLINLLLANATIAEDEEKKSDDDKPEIPQMSAKELHRPTLMPDRVILTWAGDPATTQAVTWRTSIDVKKPVAQVAPADPGPGLEQLSTTFDAATERLETDLSTSHYHSVRFENLTPATRYAYRVGDGANWSEWFQFRTASTKPEPFSFLYFGDAQNDVRSLWSRVIREAWATDTQARFMIHAGDLINRAESDADWGEWHQAGSWLNGMVPSVPAPGNHEQFKIDDDHRRLSRYWRPQFTLPENGPDELPETCYSLLYQDALIVVMNSNEQTEVQAKWLDKLLTKTRRRWTICAFHHPIFSTGKDRDNDKLRRRWKPILDKHRVDLVLQGHDHTYGRTGLGTPAPEWLAKKSEDEEGSDQNGDQSAKPSIAAENAIAENADPELHDGTVYVVSVSGPKMYDLQRHSFMQRAAQDTQLFQLIHVNGDQLHFEAWTAAGSLYDAFTLTKQSHGPNLMTEQVPDIPERLRPPVEEPVPTAKAASQKLQTPAR